MRTSWKGVLNFNVMRYLFLLSLVFVFSSCCSLRLTQQGKRDCRIDRAEEKIVELTIKYPELKSTVVDSVPFLHVIPSYTVSGQSVMHIDTTIIDSVRKIVIESEGDVEAILNRAKKLIDIDPVELDKHDVHAKAYVMDGVLYLTVEKREQTVAGEVPVTRDIITVDNSLKWYQHVEVWIMIGFLILVMVIILLATKR